MINYTIDDNIMVLKTTSIFHKDINNKYNKKDKGIYLYKLELFENEIGYLVKPTKIRLLAKSINLADVNDTKLINKPFIKSLPSKYQTKVDEILKNAEDNYLISPNIEYNNTLPSAV
jgi:hypothetical protein